MPRAQKVERTEYKFPDDQYYPCVLEKVEEREVKFQKKDKDGFKTNDQGIFYKWRWVFRIVNPDKEFDGDALYGETSSEFSTREDNKIRQWSEALLGREMEVGEELDTDTMIGLTCFITVFHGEPRKKQDGEFFYPCEVDEVLPRSQEQLDDTPPF